MSTSSTTTQRFLSRFLFCYLVLYIFPYGFEYIHSLNTNDISFWTKLTPWFGETFLGLTFDPDNLQKGFDSKYDFTRFMLCGVLSLLAATILVLAEKKYQWNYDQKLNILTHLILRYHVGFTLILYGSAKMIPLQFGVMGFDRLESVTGDYTPMSFLWTFMSYSTFYTISTGVIEVIGGLLLLFRATTLIGAVICFIAMADVVLIDIGYDVTVKFFAIHLLVMTALLLMNDLKRMILFFIPGKAIPPYQPLPTLLNTARGKRIGYVVKFALLTVFTITTISATNKYVAALYDTKYPKLSNLYRVEQFVANGDTLPPVLNDTVRWKSIALGISFDPNSLQIRGVNNSRANYNFTADTVSKTLNLKSFNDSTKKYVLKYEITQDNHFILYGKYKNDSIWMRSKPFKVNEYKLTKGGIQWIRDL